MNEVVEVHMASWQAMAQERNASVLSIKEWSAANNASESLLLSPQAAPQYSAGCGKPDVHRKYRWIHAGSLLPCGPFFRCCSPNPSCGYCH